MEILTGEGGKSDTDLWFPRRGAGTWRTRWTIIIIPPLLCNIPPSHCLGVSDTSQLQCVGLDKQVGVPVPTPAAPLRQSDKQCRPPALIYLASRAIAPSQPLITMQCEVYLTQLYLELCK